MERKTLIFPAGLVALMSAGLASPARAIDVKVNGQAVNFMGAQPAQLQGRVFVPLRGVLEQMGAEFVWDQGTKTVIGSKGDRRFELPIGSTTATVNGQVTTLDVPAQVIRGSTMVPLRFVSEALGADIAWRGATQTVEISTDEFFSAGGSDGGNGGRTDDRESAGRTGGRGGRSGRGATRMERSGRNATPTTGLPGTAAAQGSGGAEPVIESFRYSGKGSVRAGGVIETQMEGTPGGNAVFDVVGVATNVPMRETQPGHYTGRFTVPNGVNVRNARVLARLSKGTRNSPVVQAGDSITVDAQPPQILNLSPASGATVNRSRPDIYAEFHTQGDAGIDTNSVKLFVNGKDVTDQARVTPGFVIYTPTENLNGSVQVQLSVADAAGNVSRGASAFTVRPTAEGLTAATHSASRPLSPGQTLTVTAKGEPGGTATFTLPGVANNVPMRETSAGSYVGAYTVKSGDQAYNVPVKVHLAANGKTSQLDAAQPVSLTGGELHPPFLLEPKVGTKLTDVFTVVGRADPGATVRVTLTATGKLFGVLPLGGSDIVQEVRAGADGIFRSEPITPPKPLGAKNLQYRLSLVTLDPAGKTSEPMEVTFSAK